MYWIPIVSRQADTTSIYTLADTMHGYWQTTKHPWPCLLFVLPLLALYEGSMIYQTWEGLQPFRAGLDAWMARSLRAIHWTADYAPSLLIAVACIGWAVILWDRSPPESLSTLVGMFFESMVYALALWGLGMIVTTQMAHLSIATRSMQAIALMGSGLFEEVLFRLLGFGVTFWMLKLITGERSALVAAIVFSAVSFSAAHYVGPQGETWQLKIFIFRTLAGVCFATLFHYRGLGIAVGTHSAYNIIVGLLA